MAFVALRWLPLALPRLLTYAALSLPSDATCQALLQRAAEAFRQQPASGRALVLAAWADALALESALGGPLATALGLPTAIPELAEGLTTDLEGGKPPSVEVVLERAEALERLRSPLN